MFLRLGDGLLRAKFRWIFDKSKLIEEPSQNKTVVSFPSISSTISTIKPFAIAMRLIKLQSNFVHKALVNTHIRRF